MIFILSSFFPVCTFAQRTGFWQINCEMSNICWSAPETFRMINDFVQEMTNSIKTIWTEWKYAGKYVNPNRFEGNKFSPPAQNLVQGALTNVDQKISTVTALGAIAGSLQDRWWVKDLAWSTAISSKNKVFARDWKTLEGLSSLVNDKKYELWLGWWWYDSVNESNIKIMNAIIQKYSKKWILISSSKIENGVKYNNIISMLSSLLSAMKSVIAFDSVTQFDNDYSRWWLDGITIRVNYQKILDMQSEYNCAKWRDDKCDKNKTNFKNNIKKIWAWAKDSVKKSWSIVTGAIQKLRKEIYSIFNPVQKISPSKQGMKTTLVQLWGKIVKVNIDDGWIINDTSWMITNRRSIIQKKDEELVTSDLSQLPIKYTNNLSTLTNPNIRDLIDQQKADMKSASFSESQDITSKIDLMLNSINQDKKIIWTKDDWLIKNLWTACENQCGWWWKCFY